jgi:hypothetical protein
MNRIWASVVTAVAVTLGAAVNVEAGWFDDHITHPIGKGIANTVKSIGKNPVEALPVCWGHPQDCREEDKKAPVHVIVPEPTFLVTYRVDCRDAFTGADRADATVTVTSKVSTEDARNEVLRQVQSSDLCQASGDMSRVTKPGTGRWL